MCQCKETHDKENVSYRFVVSLNQSSQSLQSVSSLSDIHLFNIVTSHTAFVNIYISALARQNALCFL